MIRFYRFEIRSEPEQVPLTVFAPNWDAVEQREDYQAWLSLHQPRHIQITEHQYWDYLARENREATQVEVDEYVRTGRYARIKPNPPFYSYRHFGDHSILDPLKEILTAEYEQHLAEWRRMYEQDRNGFYDHLREICTMRTVYENLVGSIDYYPTEYMQALSELPAPLAMLSGEYEKHIGYTIEPVVKEILDMATKGNMLSVRYPLNCKALPGQSQEERMQCFQDALNAEYRDYESVWHGMDFNDTISKSMEIFTLMQLYHELKQCISQYPEDQVYAFGAIEKPLSYDKGRIVGERDLRFETVDEMNYTLPMMFPEVQPEPDVWGMQKDHITPAFSVREGSEQDCYEFFRANWHDPNAVSILRYMNRWSKLMESDMADGLTVDQAANLTRYQADTGGLSGSMYGFAVRGLCQYWQHGEELRQWHNTQYGHGGSGIVNPAVLDIVANTSNNEEITQIEKEVQTPVLQM